MSDLKTELISWEYMALHHVNTNSQALASERISAMRTVLELIASGELEGASALAVAEQVLEQINQDRPIHINMEESK